MIITNRPPTLSLSMACHYLSVNRSTVYKRRFSQSQCLFPRPPRKKSPHPRALKQEEKAAALAVLTSPEYCDQPPLQVYHSLLEKNQYLCSVSSMHRLLTEHGINGERRHQRPSQHHAIPRLAAQQPNQVWTWDITKIATQKRGEYLSLYVILDLFSRYIVGWLLSHKENSALAQQLIGEAHEKYTINQPLTLHQDRGAPMTAHAYLDLLGELAITASHSRPRVSNDNPFSEAQFKTMKFQPDYPRRFANYGHAKTWVEHYVEWYNQDHHHSQLAGFTPAQVYTGEYREIATQKQHALDIAYENHKERFVKGAPKISMPDEIVYINPVVDEDGAIMMPEEVNFPTLNRCKSNLT